VTNAIYCKTCRRTLAEFERKYTVTMCSKCINRALEGLAAADAAYNRKERADTTAEY
jgi:hypothetical protein